VEDIKPYFKKFLVAGIICLALSIYLVKTAHKENTPIQKVAGTQQNISNHHYQETTENKKPFKFLIDRGVISEVKMSWYLLGFSVFIIGIVVAGKLKGKLI
jgi:hypothetical protein